MIDKRMISYGVIGTVLLTMVHSLLWARDRQNQAVPDLWDKNAHHIIVYEREGKFCGWPANEGIWAWGNEILVGFNIGEYLPEDPGHDCNFKKPLQTVQARSVDGGVNWRLEEPKALVSGKEATPLTETINFAHPDFTLKCRNRNMFYSYDRGCNWRGPFAIPVFGKMPLMCRTDYLVNGPDECFVFVTADKPDGVEGYVFGIHTNDGAASFEFLSWIAPLPPLMAGNHAYSVQTSTVRLSKDHLLTATRERRQKKKWIDVYASKDNGRSWQWLSTPVANNSWNPPCLLQLEDGTLCLTYGYRVKPQGIRVLFSHDQGRTWSPQYYLRADGREWDLGYVRSVQRPDGKVVSIYYYTTGAMPRQHIAATIWDPQAEQD